MCLAVVASTRGGHTEVVAPRSSRMVDVVCDGGEEAAGGVQRVQQLLQHLPLEVGGRRLQHVSGVRRVVVRVGLPVVALHHQQPVAQHALVTAQGPRHAEVAQNLHSEPHQRPANTQQTFRS